MPTCSAPAVIRTASGCHSVKALTGPPEHERHHPLRLSGDFNPDGTAKAFPMTSCHGYNLPHADCAFYGGRVTLSSELFCKLWTVVGRLPMLSTSGRIKPTLNFRTFREQTRRTSAHRVEAVLSRSARFWTTTDLRRPGSRSPQRSSLHRLM
jgi:hypothetical protein